MVVIDARNYQYLGASLCPSNDHLSISRIARLEAQRTEFADLLLPHHGRTFNADLELRFRKT